MKGIQSKLKLNNDKMEEPDIYIGAELSNMDNKHKDECWAMSSKKYCTDMVKNVEASLEKKGL